MFQTSPRFGLEKTMDDRVSLVFIVGSTAAVMGIFFFTLLALITYRANKTGEINDWGICWMWGGIAVIITCVSAALLYPSDMDYHTYRQVQISVASIDVTISSQDRQTYASYVITSDQGDLYVCEDERCASVSEGDHLIASCIKKWRYYGADESRCRFIEVIGGRS